jgi:RNA polymerase sigma factor (sigma-70 family)
MTDSQNLIADYVQRGSEAAFQQLVARYLDLVYSAAFRLVDRDAHRAEDVAQMVFADLARLAGTLSNEVMLGGWLHRHTCFVAAKTMRSERGRQSRERQAVEMNALQADPGMNFAQLAPLLDGAIDELADDDRKAILLRFFEQHDFRRIGEAIGSSEDAARMRVNRALEKLQLLLGRKGITSTAAALSVVLSANAVQAAPMGLSATIAAAVAATGTSIAAAAIAATTTKAIAMTATQKALVAATLVAAVGTGLYEGRQASILRGQVRTLQEQRISLTEEIVRLNRERTDAARQLSAAQSEATRGDQNTTELLRLRNDVAQARREAVAAAATAKASEAELQQMLRSLPPVKTFVATGLATIGWDQAILTGGWKTPTDKRAIVLVSLGREAGAGQVRIKSTIVEFTDDAGERLGLNQFNLAVTDGQSTAKTHTLTADQLEVILKSAKATAGIDVLDAPVVTTLSGRQAQIQSVQQRTMPSGEPFSTGPVIDFIPTISADGQSVQLIMAAQLNLLVPNQHIEAE